MMYLLVLLFDVGLIGFLIYHYDWLLANHLIVEDPSKSQFFLITIAVFVCILFITKKIIKVPSFVYRKLLHLVAVFLTSFILYASPSYLSVILLSIILLFVVTPLLKLCEFHPWFAKFFVEKSSNEVVRSFIYLFTMLILVSSISWGIFNQKWMGLMAIALWGLGDATAAMIGIPFGRHKIKWRLSDGKKSYEGSIAMWLVASLTGIILMTWVESFPFVLSIPISLIAGAGAALVELGSSSELDTFFVPLGVLLILLVICPIFGI